MSVPIVALFFTQDAKAFANHCHQFLCGIAQRLVEEKGTAINGGLEKKCKIIKKIKKKIMLRIYESFFNFLVCLIFIYLYLIFYLKRNLLNKLRKRHADTLQQLSQFHLQCIHLVKK